MTATEALYAALRAEHGIALRCEDLVRVRQQLYAARKALADPALDALSFRQAPDGTLWITHNAQPAR